MNPLDGLNAEQRRAAEAVRGPVCILAGAGSGKTTTITRRIAQQVATGAFAPTQIMAVTFTDKAAGELKARLAALGAGGVRASTFHSAALRQLRHFGARRGGADPAVEGAGAPPDRERPARRVPVSARGRPRDGDRMGEEPPNRAGRLPRGGRRPRAADPARPDAPRLPRLRTAEGSGGDARFRGSARAHRAAVRARATTCAPPSRPSTAPSPSTSTRT